MDYPEFVFTKAFHWLQRFEPQRTTRDVGESSSVQHDVSSLGGGGSPTAMDVSDEATAMWVACLINSSLRIELRTKETDAGWFVSPVVPQSVSHTRIGL